ncbi:MAG: hypothetical protein BRC59_05495 [Cyanobacteria bacterium SW_4_48_29]|nr:MAG: hypothetical protein BRC59_05495 [Cyanobacteria bacterium SW_4_48_29]
MEPGTAFTYEEYQENNEKIANIVINQAMESENAPSNPIEYQMIHSMMPSVLDNLAQQLNMVVTETCESFN